MSEKLACCCSEWESETGNHQLSITSKSPEFLTDDQKRQIAIDGVQAILNEHNITADELPCLWLSPDKAVDMQDYLIKWDSEDYPATCTFTGEWAAHVDDGCYENPDYIMPIPPLPKGGE